jgi:hypothetical protein
MKTYILLSALALFILAGCSTTRNTSDYDDVYVSTKDGKKQKGSQEMKTSDPDYYVQNEPIPEDYTIDDYESGEYVSYEDEPVYSESETIENPDGTTYITNNYYGAGGYSDYYDYSYSARINRFYYPYAGFNYYSPCYVGFYYDPWYDPYWYSPSFYFGMSWGWGSFGWGYPYYGYPYYYYPYNNYWYGYNNGYWDGYYASQYYDNGYNSYYYGPRSSRGSTNSPYGSSASNGSDAQGSVATYSDRNRPLLIGGVVSKPATSSPTSGGRGDNANIVSDNRSNAGTRQVISKPAVEGNSRSESLNAARNVAGASAITGNSSSLEANRQTSAGETRPNSQESKPRYSYKKPEASQSSVRPGYKPGEVIDSRTRTQPQQKYSKPDAFNSDRSVSRSSGSESQRSTLYSKPKSGSTESYSRPSQFDNNNRSAQPSRSSGTNRYSQPSRSNTESYSQPSRSNSNYSRPTNEGNSRSSYSRPSSSGSGSGVSRSSSGTSSYSAPSRSSSGTSGGRSTGGRR